ncbi:ABC transporter substrate-binding protein [Phytohabitans sp. ZYX-F-186]|uniref:ABC transporter substrate-binding protein n=1 Tax=Phytohabitans maris TaxID=3071409 RepID=A0ABU0ZNS7_9ACTN|nr:ABC transporter substrate-binding protein [Phytohabitans sp. ZYX-F-186]MDQ7907582.1 ABC transporter substrate-binding protein [Phytohabitans sp. ZYX-F-186]
MTLTGEAFVAGTADVRDGGRWSSTAVRVRAGRSRPVPAGGGGVSRRVLGAGVLAAGVAVAAGACSDDGAGAAGQEVEQVTFLTTVGKQGRDAAAFVAEAKGFFAAHGLKVDIQPGRAGDYNHQQLAAGSAQYATVDGAGAVVRYATGKDTSFQVLAAVHQQTVVGIVGLAGGRISSDPRSLVGRTLGTIKNAVPEVLWPAYAKAAGIDAKSVTWRYAATADQLNQLVAAGTIDGSAQFVIGAPGIEAAAGKAGRKPEAVVIPYSTHLGSLYGGVLIAQKSTIDAHPAQAKRFAAALSMGLDYAVKNPQEAGQIMADQAGQDPVVAAAELERMRAYVFAAGVTTAGALDETRVAGMVGSLTAHGLIPQGMNPDLPKTIARFDLAPAATS